MKVYLALFTLFFFASAIAKEKLPELSVKEIDKGVFLHKSYQHVDGFGLVSSNGLVVIDNNKAFIIDTPWSEQDTVRLVKWIEDKNIEVIASISTHWHADRTAGVKWLNSRAIITYASALTYDLLKANNKVLTLESFAEQKFVLAENLLEAYYPGGGHTIDNIVIWLPNSNILFGGCLIRGITSKSLGYTAEADIKNWKSSVERLRLNYPAVELVVPGHGNPGGINLLTHTQNLVDSTLSQ